MLHTDPEILFLFHKHFVFFIIFEKSSIPFHTDIRANAETIDKPFSKKEFFLSSFRSEERRVGKEC